MTDGPNHARNYSVTGTLGLVTGMWLAVLIAALSRWADLLHPAEHPLVCWLGWWAILILPVVIGCWRSRLGNGERVPRWMIPYRRGVLIVALTAAVAATVTYSLAMRPFVESCDFFHHVNFARDMLRVPALVPESCYRYAPGGYAFWRTVQRLWPGDLAALQWSFLSVLAANAIFVGLIVWRATRERCVAIFAGVWMMVLFSRFEGFSGIPEPLVTLPYLIGMFLWQGRPFAGRDGWKRTVYLGLGLGFAVAMKQQGGLLALGAVAFWLPLMLPTSAVRPDWRQLCLLPAVALFAVALVLAHEGRGLVPLEWGLRQVESYPAHASFAANLWSQIRNDESLALAFTATAAVWLLAFSTRRGREWLMQPSGQIVSFCLIGAAAAMYQFTRRGYYHYSLIALPAVVIATTITAVVLYRRFFSPFDKQESRSTTESLQRELLLWLVMLAAAFPLFYTGGNPANLHVWRWTYGRSFEPKPIWRYQSDEVAADVAAVQEKLPAAAEMLVLPPRKTALYYVLDGQSTVFANGYYWDPQPEMLREAIADRGVDFVVEVHRRNEEGDEENWTAFDGDAAVRMLPEEGFRSQLVTPTMTLWSRAVEPTKISPRDIDIAPITP